MAIIGSDIFKAMNFANQIQKKFYDVEDQTTLSIGTFGAEAELFGRTLQNSIRVASELSNEAIPTKAKYPKNIMAHAYYTGLTDLNAHPAYMPVQIIIPKNQVDDKMVGDTFTWDKDIAIDIEGFEFHTDYDIVITRNKIGTNKFVYTAMYDMSITNPVSDITKPYLPPIGIISTISGTMLIIPCIVRQITLQTINHRTLSDNDIENKTYTFSFDSNYQLADFDIEATEGDKTYYITPVYDGAINSIEGYTCEYQYIDTNQIRIKFSRDSYLPKINTLINIRLRLTKGAAGNIPASKEVIVDVTSTRFNYKGLYASVKPTSDADDGRDKKSIAEIKKSIPKEAMSRGTISSTIDLANFFNSFNNNDSRLYPYKRKYNGIDHMYYAYLVMKKNGNVVPTNTIDIKISTNQLTENETSYVIPPLQTFLLDENGIGVLVSEEDIADLNDLDSFIYTNPFMIIINKNPMMISYYLNILEVTKYVEYDYINQSVQLQMVMSSLLMQRSGVVDRNKYHIDFQITQNINNDFGLVRIDEDTKEMFDDNIKVFIVLYPEEGSNIPYRYIPCTFIDFLANDYLYTYSVELETDDTILIDNKIKITNLLQPSSGLVVDSYISNGCPATIYILAKLDRVYGEDPITTYIPGLEGYSLCNKYKIDGGIDVFYNYTQLMNSIPELQIPKDDEDNTYHFEIKKVPMVRKSYMKTESRIMAVVNELEARRQYIEYCLTRIEGGFEIDFKFVNTYGPSKRFFLKDSTNINRTTLSLQFEAKLYSPSDKYIIDLIKQDIQESIDDINSINEIHFSNLITEIKNVYGDQLYYFEFLGFNNYGPGQQYIRKSDTDLRDDVPEFLNVNTLDTGNVDIDITVI